jgi:hypothetical protein
MSIDQILKEIKEDKIDNLSTTSFQFKRDIWDFFQDYQDKIAVEFGTHKGQTTRILSFLFKKVYTVNINDNQASKQLNGDRSNIVHIDNFDLYSTGILPIQEAVDMFLVDAGHGYDDVILDINRVISMKRSSECYVVFDDFGLDQYSNTVKQAIQYAVDSNVLEYIGGIGHSAGCNFGGIPPRILTDHEGVVTRVL